MARSRARRAHDTRAALPWIVLVLVLGLVLAGCRDDPVTPTVPAEGPLRLRLSVEPEVGDAPLTAQMRAVLVGELASEDVARFRCATAAFSTGNDNVQLVPPQQPCADEVQRIYETSYTFEAADTYPVTVRLIARPVRPSRPVQILVRGSTPTPAALAAVPGPTIIIATPVTPPAPAQASDGQDTDRDPGERAAAGIPTVAPPPSERDGPSGQPFRPTPTTPRPTERTPLRATLPPAAEDLPALLPADLYYLAGDPARLARLPTSGDAPQAIGEPSEARERAIPVTDYTVSSLGLIAMVRGDALSVVTAMGDGRTVAPRGSDSPVWSYDGRRLAYRRDGALHLFDVVDFQARRLDIEARPMAFSRGGRWLLVRDGADRLALADLDATPVSLLPLPLAPARHAGWVGAEDVLWLTGPGLRFVRVGDAIQVTTVVPLDVESSTMLVRPDRNALLLLQRERSMILHLVDLEAPTVEAELVGVPLPVPMAADFAWSPDGRTLAVAGGGGMALLDPVTGGAVPLVDGPARRPTWVLTDR